MTGPVVTLAPGTRLMFDGDVVEVLALEGTRITLRNVRTEAPLTVGLTGLVCAARSVAAPVGAPVSEGAALAGLTDRQRREAQERAEHVREVLTGFRSGRAERPGRESRIRASPVRCRCRSATRARRSSCSATTSAATRSSPPGRRRSLARPSSTPSRPPAVRYRVSGHHFKGVNDEDGNQLGAGAIRDDPWTVIAPVAAAIAVLERIEDDTLLLPRRIGTVLLRPRAQAIHRGDALTPTFAATRIDKFIAYANQLAARHGLDHEMIPDDPDGPINFVPGFGELSRGSSTGCPAARRPGHSARAPTFDHVGVHYTCPTPTWRTCCSTSGSPDPAPRTPAHC